MLAQAPLYFQRPPLRANPSYTYDAFNRLLSVTSPKNETTSYAYLATGELAQVKDPKGDIMSLGYDPLGRLTSKTDALGFTTTRQYDGNGNLVKEVDPNGNVKSYAYDLLNRLTQKTLPDNIITLSYDIRGNVTNTANQQSTLGFGYDTGNRMVSAQSSGAGISTSLGFTYDADGNRATLADPIGTTTYAYDNADRLTQITNPKGEVYTFGFDAANRLTSITRPGSSTTLSFDDANFVTNIAHSSGSLTLATFGYQMDAIGNRIAIATVAGTYNYGYDTNNQLTSATSPEAQTFVNSGRAPASDTSETFAYDSIANRASDAGGAYIYDSKSQRLTEDYRNTYTYDSNGNLIAKTAKGLNGATTNYYYSSENQLLSFKVYDPAFSVTQPLKEVAYTYDPLGRRIQKSVQDNQVSSNSFTRKYLYDGQEIIAEYDGANSLLARYTHSTLHTDDILAVDVKSAGVAAGLAQNAQTYTYLKDVQGTIRDVSDPNGNKIQHYVYSAFGTLLGIQDAQANDVTLNSPLRTSFTFTGRELNTESGLYFNRARYYDSNIGRFIQKDPSPGKISIPGTAINAFAYAGNRPNNFRDSSGRSWIDKARVAISSGIGGFIGGITGAGIWALLQDKNMVKELGLAIGGGIIGIAAAPFIGEGLIAGAIFGGVLSGAQTAAGEGTMAEIALSSFFGGIVGLAGAQINLAEATKLEKAFANILISTLLAPPGLEPQAAVMAIHNDFGENASQVQDESVGTDWSMHVKEISPSGLENEYDVDVSDDLDELDQLDN